MREKVVLVTRATAGIGFFSALGLASQGARVIITGRNEARGRAAEAELRRRAGHLGVTFLPVDHASFAENQRLGARVADEYGRLDVLVNGTGDGETESAPERGPDGYDLTLTLDFLGPFALTDAVLALLLESPESRVVNVVSPRASAGRLNLLWTLSLARELWGSPVVVNAVDPAGCSWYRRSPERAARPVIAAAFEPAYASVTGFLFGSNGRPESAPRFALDATRQTLARSLALRLVASAGQSAHAAGTRAPAELTS